MGTRKAKPRKPGRSAEGLASALFSKSQQRVLGVLFAQPERSFYGNEVVRAAGGGTGAVQRELARLAAAGLINVSQLGHQKHYQVNEASPIYTELRGIVLKTVGLADPLRAALGSLRSHIKAAFVFGSVAKRSDSASSDIDLIVLSDDLGYSDLIEALMPTSARLGREVNPTLLTTADLARRRREGGAFLKRVTEQPKIWLMGDMDVLAIGEPDASGLTRGRIA